MQEKNEKHKVGFFYEIIRQAAHDMHRVRTDRMSHRERENLRRARLNRFGHLDEIYSGKELLPSAMKAPDMLLDMHEAQFDRQMQMEMEPAHQVELMEQDMRGIAERYRGKKKLPGEVLVAICEQFSDEAVADYLLQGAGNDFLKNARFFTANVRRQYARQGASERVVKLLSLIEMKYDAAEMVQAALAKWLHVRGVKADTLYDAAWLDSMQRPRPEPEELNRYSDEALEKVDAYAIGLYKKALQDMGLEMHPPVPHSFYSLYLAQEAAHVARAEFFSQKARHAPMEGQSRAQAMQQHVAARVPELVRQALDAHPPTDGLPPAEALVDAIVPHDALRLARAVDMLRGVRGQLPAQGRG